MGISTTSLVGTPLLQRRKTKKEPAEDAFVTTAAAYGQSVDDVQRDNQGLLYANPCVEDAAITDLFGGDEVGNAASVDLSKVQRFLFTMIAALVYAVLIYQELDTKSAAELTGLPLRSEAFIAVHELSHGRSPRRDREHRHAGRHHRDRRDHPLG